MGHTGHSDPQSDVRITKAKELFRSDSRPWISSQEAGRWEFPAKLRSESGHELNKVHENRGHGLYRS